MIQPLSRKPLATASRLCGTRTERPGFEPGSHLLGSYAISSRVLSTAQTPLHCKRFSTSSKFCRCVADPKCSLSMRTKFLQSSNVKTFERRRAERVGFEPTRALRPYRFSRPAPSTTQPPLQSSLLRSEGDSIGGGNAVFPSYRSLAIMI